MTPQLPCGAPPLRFAKAMLLAHTAPLAAVHGCTCSRSSNFRNGRAWRAIGAAAAVPATPRTAKAISNLFIMSAPLPAVFVFWVAVAVYANLPAWIEANEGPTAALDEW